MTTNTDNSKQYAGEAATNMTQACTLEGYSPEPTGYGQLPPDPKGRKTILVTNDDGYGAPGLVYLTGVLRDLARIVVVAPDGPRSGCSSSFTSTKPVTLKRVEDDGDVALYACSGTPIDCVKLALHRLFSQVHPDLIVSGINHGGNDSICIMYSGTMGAVLEGCVVGVPAIGFSLLDHRREADFSATGEYIRDITAQVLANPMDRGVSLNINIPATADLKGVRVCRQAKGMWWKEFHYVEGDENSGEATFFVTGEYRNEEPEATDTDRYWLERGYISVVPVQVDYTSHNHIGQLGYLERDAHR